MKMPKTILIISQKGGVGKTTIADEVLFELERRDLPYTFYELDDQGGNVHKAVKNPEAQFVVVDTPGGLSADYPKWIHASDLVILPTKPSFRDMQPFLRTCAVIRKNIRPGACAMFVVNMINMRFKATKDYIAWLKAAMEEKRESFTDDYHWCLEFLPQSEMAVQAPAYGKSVIDFAPQSDIAKRLEKMNIDIFKLWRSDMAKENMFDSVFNKSVAEPAVEPKIVPEKAVQAEETSVSAKSDGLFCLKDLPEQDRKPTTIIFSKRNLAFLKKMAIDENLNMSEVVNRWLEGRQAES